MIVGVVGFTHIPDKVKVQVCAVSDETSRAFQTALAALRTRKFG
jgi:hypothetical protein